MRSSIVLLLLLGASFPIAAEEPVPVEDWRFNSRSQTAAGIRGLSADDPERALEHFESARRLAPGNPLTVFNEATAQLIAKNPNAAESLREAIPALPPELAASAHYNLGNALLAQNDPASAIESYKEALRLEPGSFDAKFNLELAQLLLKQQQERQEQGEDGDRQDSEENGDAQPRDSSAADSDAGEGDGTREQAPAEPGEQSQQPGADTQGEEREPRATKSPLSSFEEQPDMTAEQAASILEAIENLEREERRREAKERARRRARSGKDW